MPVQVESVVVVKKAGGRLLFFTAFQDSPPIDAASQNRSFILSQLCHNFITMSVMS